jgi:hypothetical protein
MLLLCPLQVDFDPKKNPQLSRDIRVSDDVQAARVRSFHLTEGICRKVFFHIAMPDDKEQITFLTNLATEENRSREAANIQTSGQSVLSQFRKMRQNVPLAMEETRKCLTEGLKRLRQDADAAKKQFKSPLVNLDGSPWDPNDENQPIPFHCDSFKMVVADEQMYFADSRLANPAAEQAKLLSYGLKKEIDRAHKFIDDGLLWPEQKIPGKRKQYAKQDPPLNAAAKERLKQEVEDELLSTPPPRTPSHILYWFLAKCIESHQTRLSVAVSTWIDLIPRQLPV